jgi:hypothetical protein
LLRCGTWAGWSPVSAAVLALLVVKARESDMIENLKVVFGDYVCLKIGRLRWFYIYLPQDGDEELLLVNNLL